MALVPVDRKAEAKMKQPETKIEMTVKKTGILVRVPKSPIAKLMYYLNCVCICVEAANEDATLNRLRDYKNHSKLSDKERAQLLNLCQALSPENLISSIFFPVVEAADIGGNDNQFFKLEAAVTTKLVIADSIQISGERKRVQKIMMFTKRWMQDNYDIPIVLATPPRPLSRRRRARCIVPTTPRARRRQTTCCNIS